jgi:homogentisate 1,2-dioxygenase
MTYYQQRGTIPAKRFTILPRPEGGHYCEELYNSSGFNGPASLLYRLYRPTRVVRVEPVSRIPIEPWDEGVVRNHIFDPNLLKASGDVWDARVPIAFNADVVYSITTPDTTGERFLRNGGKDELYVVVEGTGTVESTFGEFSYGPLDFVYIPRGTTWRLTPDDVPQRLIVIETTTPIGPLAKYRNTVGQFLSQAIYSERDLRVPELADPIDEQGEFEVAVKVGDVISSYHYETHPFDVIGWDGALYPYALNMRDLEPFSGRVNLNPDIDGVFEARGVLVAAHVPARLPDHPNAYPNIPDHNTDCDEIFYRIATESGAMAGVGKVTVHTRAGGHGAKPGMVRSEPGLRSELWGVILDIVEPLQLTTNAVVADDPNYPAAWL